jgi:hypothetical protein
LGEKDIFHELDDLLEVVLLKNQNLKTVVDHSSLVVQHFVNADLKNTVGRNE